MEKIDYFTVEFIDQLTPEQLKEGFLLLRRKIFTLKIQLENSEGAVNNLVEKIEQLENLKVYEGLDQQIFE